MYLQHQRAHDDPAAMSASFADVVLGKHTDDKSIKGLMSRMIKPGFYYEHIQKWRKYYSDKQVKM